MFLQGIADSCCPFHALGGTGWVVAVVAVTEEKVVLKMEGEVAEEVETEKETVLKDALFAFVTPCIDAILQGLLVAFGVFDDLLECGWVGSFEDKEAHEV